MKDPHKEYEAALADFSRPGNRNATQGKLSYWGKAAGMTAEEIVMDALAAGVRDRNADIRSGWNRWEVKGKRASGQRHAPRTKPKPPETYPGYVRDMIAAGGGEAKSRDLLALSPFPVPTDGRTQTAAFLRGLYKPDDILHVTRAIMMPDGKTTFLSAKPGKTLKPCGDWLAQLQRGEALPGDYFVPNPFSGEEGETKDGKKSYIAESCLVRFPFVEIEFDDMPLKTQAAFWRGLLTSSHLAPFVASITYSGGKSLHGLVYVGKDSELDWRKMVYYKDEFGQECGRLYVRFATDPEHSTDAKGKEHWPFRVDKAGLRPRQATRLPGVHRIAADGTRGKMQSLLYLNPETTRTTAAKSTTQDKPQNPPSARSVPPPRNHATETHGRGTGAEIGVSAHVPLDRLLADAGAFDLATDEDLDAVLADEEAREACEATGVCRRERIPRPKEGNPQGPASRETDT